MTMDVAGRPRWLGLDALRGLSIAAMILVNNPGRWGADWQYAPLRHADWHGCTFTDLVFPTFLFCAGVAIVPAMQRQLEASVPRRQIAAKIGRRVFWLVLLGLFLSAFPLLSFDADRVSLLDPVWNVRLPGVLQRIGICYGFAALLFLYASRRTAMTVLLLCLLLYWPMLTLIPVPGVGAPDLGGPMGTLPAFVDRAIFGDHIWVKGQYDPEGLLSTVPALATCLLGVEAGRMLAAGQRGRDLVISGLIFMAAAFGWSRVLPFNKALWTSSYALWAGGIAMAALGALHAAAARPGAGRWLRPLQVYGVNALLVFVGSGVLARVVGGLITVTTADGAVSLKTWFFDNALSSWAEPKVASLLFALLWVFGWYGVLAALFRRGIVWKV